MLLIFINYIFYISLSHSLNLTHNQPYMYMCVITANYLQLVILQLVLVEILVYFTLFILCFCWKNDKSNINNKY